MTALMTLSMSMSAITTLAWRPKREIHAAHFSVKENATEYIAIINVIEGRIHDKRNPTNNVYHTL